MKPHEHVIMEIARERERQIADEGWTAENDDTHHFGDLAMAAAAYACNSAERGHQGDVMVGRCQQWTRAGWFNLPKLLWPWSNSWWKPTNRRRDLIKAGALIVAEIERLDRAAAKAPEAA